MARGGWFNFGDHEDFTTLVRRRPRVFDRVRKGGFATVELNAVGWVALVGPGVVAGLLFARLTERSFLLWGAVGGVIVWAIAVTLDNVRDGQRPGRLHTDPIDAESLHKLTEAARHAGITFTHEDVDDENGQASVLHAKNRHLDRLANILWQVRDQP